MDPAIILIVALAIIGPAIIFILKLCLFAMAASVVARAISPTVIVKGDKNGDNNQ